MGEIIELKKQVQDKMGVDIPDLDQMLNSCEQKALQNKGQAYDCIWSLVQLVREYKGRYTEIKKQLDGLEDAMDALSGELES